mmetsp:Transcript_10418/g.26736  ORF Transcript_10418/g.26736 Transcript_10418/m.26736 type:complete len:303 (-) Transcript_10418:150-1058(-)
MSRSEGVQYRGVLDKYDHSSASVLNDPAYYFDAAAQTHRRWDDVSSTEPSGAAVVDAQEQIEPVGQQQEDPAPEAAIIPPYRCPGVSAPQVPAPITVKPAAWKDPWSRAPRYTRNPDGIADRIWEAPPMEAVHITFKKAIWAVVPTEWALESGGWIQVADAAEGSSAQRSLRSHGLLVDSVEAIRTPDGAVNPGRTRKLTFANGHEIIETIYAPPAEHDMGNSMYHDIQGYAIGGMKQWTKDPLGVKYGAITMHIAIETSPTSSTVTWTVEGNVSSKDAFCARLRTFLDDFSTACLEKFGTK